MSVQSFQIEIPQIEIDELERRLATTRWPDEIAGAGWDYGTNLDYLKELGAYWQNEFDWVTQQNILNSFAHFRADLDGLGIHFIHERGKGSNPLPLILTHGWPDSFVRMLKLIPRLTNPESFGGNPTDSFDVIVPSIPGFSFSDRATQPGMRRARIAELWTRLMRDELGYKRFAAHGGDIGAGVTKELVLANPELLVGIHLTDIGYPYNAAPPPNMSQAEQNLLATKQSWRQTEGGYIAIQSTKPQTLAYGLSDSPIGLAAWIIEKFRAWSDCEGDLEKCYTKDELLTNISLYWFTNTINSANRIYYEEVHNPQPLTNSSNYVSVPTGVAIFSKDIEQPPREWGERSYNIQRWTQLPRGGHFAALEQPDLLAEDIRAFFRPLR
jgi:pimeloyl-ACP methyl ester carboxylesterase